MDFTDVLLSLNNIKDNLSKKGLETLRLMGKTFRKMKTYDGANQISKEDFFYALRELGIILNKTDIEIVLNFMDRERENILDVDEFLTAIRGKPNSRRQAIIDKAFLKFDKDGNGHIDVSSLKACFNSTKHPKVISGEFSQELVFSYFLKNFNDFYGIGKIDRKEWNDYYSAVSYSVDNDDNFILLMKNNWSLE